MKIKIVTITGADDNTNHQDLIEISKKYPFVEWGILFSPTRNDKGESRYPTIEWVNKFKKDVIAHNFTKIDSFMTNGFDLGRNEITIMVSAHICGGYTKELLEGNNILIKEKLKDVYSHLFLNRSQWNFNSSKNEVHETFYDFLNNPLNGKTILQFNKANYHLCQKVIEMNNHNIHFLYDGSGGRGVLPNEWTGVVPNHFTGYAGGLNPDNLEEALINIEKSVGDNEIWIDTETGVRTDDKLDLDKVVGFLEIAKKYT
jgi:phosphoribosylanthranilate isomerase